MKLVLIHSLIAAFFLQIGGCGGGSSNKSEERTFGMSADQAVTTEVPPSKATEAAPAQTVAQKEGESSIMNRKLIYNAQLRMQVKDLEASVKHVKDITNKAGGYYTNESHAGGGGEKSVSFSLRIPAERFENTLTALEQLASYVQHKQTTTQDVTENYYDAEIRLKTKRKTLDQYYAILQKTTTVKDVLEVQAKINDLETEIESLEGKLRYLTNQVSYSTIDVTLYIPIPFDRQHAPDPTDSFLPRLTESFTSGWKLLRELVFGLIAIWPLILITTLALWYYRRRKQQGQPLLVWWRKKKQSQTPASAPDQKS
jgi:hypothetical protein